MRWPTEVVVDTKSPDGGSDPQVQAAVGRMIVGLQQFGFGLAIAILIDVTIIRALLVPSAMKLFGRWNWWLPDGAARIFRVQPSPLAPSPGSPALKPAGR